MILRDGTVVTHRVKDSWGENGYLLWVENCFDPPVFFVRGQNFSDAYEWFICDPLVEAWLKVDDYYEDYIEGWDGKWVYGVGTTNPATLEDLEKAYSDSKTHSIEWNDNGVLVDTSAVNGKWWKGKGDVG